jgi:Glyoxalase/Bleomycin resistance protein/Dioxygenase superfamily
MSPEPTTKKGLVGRQAADMPLFSIETNDSIGEYQALKKRGVEFEGEPEVHPYGTGVLMRDLYGNKIHLNQD